jgi:hypothetical protein
LGKAARAAAVLAARVARVALVQLAGLPALADRKRRLRPGKLGNHQPLRPVQRISNQAVRGNSRAHKGNGPTRRARRCSIPIRRLEL